MVYDKQIYQGLFTVPNPSKDQLITVYEQALFKDKDFGCIDILYFQDLNYGIAITDKMVGYLKNK